MAGLNGRVALVTGATSAIGQAIARLLASRGAILALHDGGRPEAAMVLAGEILAAGGEAAVFAAEMTDPLAVQRMVDEVYRQRGRLDVLVNAHEEVVEGLLLNLTAEEWQRTFDQNVHGAFYAIQAAARYMLLDRRGRIVNLSGLAASHPSRGQLAFAAAKGALDALTRALAMELSGKQITINAVAPGLIAGMPLERLGLAEPERLTEQVPLRRLGTAEDVAEMVAFLASDEASYITGETFFVDGGLGGRR